MNKYIDAEALKHDILFLFSRNKELIDEWLVYCTDDVIDNQPAADVTEVVRCKECKHWDKTWTNDWAPDYHYCPMIDGTRKGDFYCADAERRTSG